MGDFVYYKTGAGKKVVCRVTSLASSPHKGFSGKFVILEGSVELPKTWANLYLLHQKVEGYINIGVNDKGDLVKFRVNPFFRHVLVGGITGKGKTHTLIAMQEEFLKHEIPSIVIDTQGEFIHLNAFSSRAVVVEDIRFEDLLSHLRFKKTIVYNLQGLSYRSKAQRCFEVLSNLREAKESDYKQAENDVKLLKIPPVIVVIDETEVYAPEHHTRTLNKDCRDTLVDLAKRGGKIGIALVVSSQRLSGLHHDVRSQCNTHLVFHINDSGSRTVLSQLPYMSWHDLKRVKNLRRGECLVTGELVPHPQSIMVRDIETPRAKNLDFEEMLGLTPLPVEPETPDEKADLQRFQETMKKGISFAELSSKFPIRPVPTHGKCVVVPERYFKPGWTATLEMQGCKVVHCPDMRGGSCYIVRNTPLKEMKA